MKQEDFERLKAVCEKEGFDISTYRESDDNGTLIHIKPKDIWEGVEFASHHAKGIAKIKRIKGCFVYFEPHQRVISTDKKFLKPSTESAYVEQLKKEAFERYGEIKEGDRFDRTSVNPIWGNKELAKLIDGTFYLQYDKILDRLFHGNLCVYEKGKWATKLPKRIEVKYAEAFGTNKYLDGRVYLDPHLLVSESDIDLSDDNLLKELGEFLAQQLEKYLNGEIE